MRDTRYHSKYTSTADGSLGFYWSIVLDDPSEWTGKEFHTGLYLVFKWDPEAGSLEAVARSWKTPRFSLALCDSEEEAERLIDAYVARWRAEQ